MNVRWRNGRLSVAHRHRDNSGGWNTREWLWRIRPGRAGSDARDTDDVSAAQPDGHG